MKNIAQAFQNADAFSGAELEKLQNILQLMAGHPDFKAYKETSYQVLELTPDSHVADVACGLGFDLPHLRDRVPKGSVTGFDLSTKFLASAMARIEAASGSGQSFRFQKSDIKALAAPPESFDAARVDRSLQHIPDPDAAIDEMLRIIKPGGIISAAEPDWRSLAVVSSHLDIAARILTMYDREILNPHIGGELKGLIGARANLTHHSVHPLRLSSRAEACQICILDEMSARSVEAGLITRQEHTAFWRDLEERDAAGGFEISLNIHLVAGRKPGPCGSLN